MKIKVIIILIGIFTIQFISSCCDALPFFDFTKMDVRLSSPDIDQDTTLDIVFEAKDIQLLSNNLSNLGFTSTLALSCVDGEFGMKFPFEKIEITSNADFNDEYKVNSNLFELFEIKQYKTLGLVEYVKLSDVILEEIYGDFIELRLSQRPMASLKHNFTFKFTKSNKEEIIVETGEITWL